MRKILAVVCILALALSAGMAFAEVKNPDKFVFASYGTLRTLDPSVAYDTVSSQRLWNLYEPLVFFDGSSTDKFVPVLCTEVPTVANGGISKDGLTYTFKIRQGVKFHKGGELSAKDVAYSLKRNMIADPDGGPMWMMLEAVTGKGSTRDKDGKIIPGIFETIDKAIKADGNTVTIKLPVPYPPLMGILAYSSNVIMDMEWCVQQGCWDGDIANAAKYNNPKPGHEPLQKIANGTNAYMMKSWEPSKEFVFERFNGYWGKNPPIKTAIFKYVKEWSTRKLMLQNGDADRVIVDLPYAPEVKAMKGVKTYETPLLSVTCAFFNQKINPTGNPNIGSGKLDGKGIPVDFFQDANVRKAFLHAFDRETYKQDVFNGLVILPTSPNIKGLPYHKDAPIYAFDLEKSKEYLMKAFDGKIWEMGFKMTIVHNTGNDMREAAAHMLAENIMSLNPKFQIEVRNVPWKDYLVKYRQFMYPIFLIGWGADYADPHNFLYTFMHSQGVYGRYMGYSNPEVDKLCDDGIKNVDPAIRKKVYHKLQDMWYSEALGVPLYQQISVRAYRDYVHGYVPNAMLTDENDMLQTLYKK